MACSCKQWHKSVKINRNYNLKGIIDNYDFCHNRAALTVTMISKHKSQKNASTETEASNSSQVT